MKTEIDLVLEELESIKEKLSDVESAERLLSIAKRLKEQTLIHAESLETKECLILLQKINFDQYLPKERSHLLEKIFSILSAKMNWAICIFWEFNTENDELTYAYSQSKDKFRFGPLENLSRSLILKEGIGLPGKVLKSRSPETILDVCRLDHQFPRAELATKLGLKNAFAFPIFFENKILGVFEVFDEKEITLKENLLADFLSIGRQIGATINDYELRKKLQHSSAEMAEQFAIYSEIIENIPAAVFMKDANDNYRFKIWNKSAEDIFEIPKAEILGKTDRDFFSEELSAHYLKKDQQTMDEGLIIDIPEEYSVAKKRGPIVLHTKKVPLKFGENNNRQYLLGISDDITAQVCAQHRLRDALELAEKTISNAFLCVITYDVESGQCLQANDFAETLTAVKREDLKKQNFLLLASWKECGLYQSAIEVIETGKEIRKVYFLKSTAGKEVWIDAILSTFMSGDKKRLMFMADDITLKKASEESNEKLRKDLAESQQQLTDILKQQLEEAKIISGQTQQELTDYMRAINDSSIVTITDPRGIIIGVNDRFCEISGYKKEELIGQGHRLVRSDKHSREFFKGMWDTIRSKNVWRGEVCSQAKDGRLFWLQTTITPIIGPDGKISRYVAIREDITEIKELHKKLIEAKEARESELVNELKSSQAQLVQSAKLASLGEMSSGLAHELNNPLSFIKGFNNRIKAALDKEAPLSKELIADYSEEISYGVNRMATIINHFRDFSRLSRNDMGRVNLTEVIQKSFVLFQEQLRLHSIDVEFHLCEAEPVIIGDAIALEQVMVNLVSNAKDALSEKQTSVKKVLRVSLRIEDSRAVITLSDNGSGIKEENLQKIFDPFFSTKEVGKGTGLGLSISYGIIKNHKGDIVVESKEGNGTSFTISFPLY